MAEGAVSVKCRDCGTEMLRWQIPPASPEMICPRCGRRYVPRTRATVPGDRRRIRAALTH